MAETALLTVLKILMTLICACWVSLWILKPTQMWTRRWKEAEDRFRPTVFGYYGLNFVVFTFPVIALAIVGSFYLNFQLRKPRRLRRKAFSGLSNPVVVNTLVGTLTALEILAASLFVLFLVWTFYARISNDLKKLTPAKSLKMKLWQLKYLRVATRFGLLAEACLALLLLPILRGLALFRLLGIQFEGSVRYHIWLGTAMIAFAFVHGASTLFIWGVSHHIQEEIGKWQRTGRVYLAGEITLVTGLVIWITALPQIRRKKFEIFYYTHHLYLVFLVFFLFHAGDRHFYMVFPGIFLFGIDKLLRLIQSRPETCILSAKIFPSKALELVLPKHPKLKYTPTSVIFVKIPSISKFQWHSFSITSSSSVDDHTMSLLIKCQGSWTSSLYNLINTELTSGSNKMKTIPIAVEGPYGPSSTDFLSYDSLLLIAGGVGITPFLSIMQEITSAWQSGNHIQYPTRIQLVFIAKSSQDICLLSSISHLILNQSAEQFHLKLKVFVTQEQQSGATVRELLNEFLQGETVNFGTDSSSFAIHGLESFLWMASIAGLSSIVFLAFLICFSHIFVPNQNTKASSKEKNPSWVADLIILSSFVIAIICSSLVALVVRWKKLNKETIQASEKHVKSWQPSSIEAGLGGALEKHEIHYTGRPNFQEILKKFPTETGGSDIGVLVCGPETMKESVALLCSQNSQCFKCGAEKKTSFTFHSLNFTL
ncbi:ferric reduction oxidase 8, mitochondrial [Humulus lupulus]|uniref:ferric reduction oxidase 8, mitochondrial n=1 Tax=Humulus lupulus TaxID=3486 RepID=UPI002B408CDD|nr:ferric reduction oxidase 8, mitochondrial [Humulus lupulus]